MPSPVDRDRATNCSAIAVEIGPKKTPRRQQSTICTTAKLPKDGLSCSQLKSRRLGNPQRGNWGRTIRLLSDVDARSPETREDQKRWPARRQRAPRTPVASLQLLCAHFSQPRI